LSRHNTSGLRFYSLLRKEVYAANKQLKKPLSAKKLETVIGKQLFPVWQGKGYSRVRVTDVRTRVNKALKKASGKKNKGIQVYNKILHEVSELNKRVIESQRLTIKEQRAFVSQSIYPAFKNTAVSKINIEALRRIISAELKKLKKDICDVLAIPENVYQAINYFDIDDFLGSILPPCIFAEVVAGEYGRTEILNTKEYNFYGSGVQQITSNINNAIRNHELEDDTNNIPFYSGQVQLRPAKPNDGNPENYYLQLVLYINRVPVEDSEKVRIPKQRKKKTVKKKSHKEKVKKYILERIKKLPGQKSKVKPIRQRVSKRIKEAEFERVSLRRLIKLKIVPQNTIKIWARKSFEKEKTKLDAYRKKGTLKKYQYDELVKLLTNAFK
jgi:hypothetical protein